MKRYSSNNLVSQSSLFLSEDTKFKSQPPTVDKKFLKWFKHDGEDIWEDRSELFNITNFEESEVYQKAVEDIKRGGYDGSIFLANLWDDYKDAFEVVYPDPEPSMGDETFNLDREDITRLAKSVVDPSRVTATFETWYISDRKGPWEKILPSLRKPPFAETDNWYFYKTSIGIVILNRDASSISEAMSSSSLLRLKDLTSDEVDAISAHLDNDVDLDDLVNSLDYTEDPDEPVEFIFSAKLAKRAGILDDMIPEIIKELSLESELSSEKYFEKIWKSKEVKKPKSKYSPATKFKIAAAHIIYPELFGKGSKWSGHKFYVVTINGNDSWPICLIAKNSSELDPQYIADNLLSIFYHDIDLGGDYQIYDAYMYDIEVPGPEEKNKEEIEKLEAEVEKIEERIEEQKQKIEEKEEEIEELSDEIDQVWDKYEDDDPRQEKEEERLEKKIAKLESQIEKLKDDLESLEVDLDDKQDEIDQLSYVY